MRLRFKTREEFEKEYGDNWREIVKWKSEMDPAFGEPCDFGSKPHGSYLVSIRNCGQNNFFVNAEMLTEESLIPEGYELSLILPNGHSALLPYQGIIKKGSYEYHAVGFHIFSANEILNAYKNSLSQRQAKVGDTIRIINRKSFGLIEVGHNYTVTAIYVDGIKLKDIHLKWYCSAGDYEVIHRPSETITRLAKFSSLISGLANPSYNIPNFLHKSNDNETTSQEKTKVHETSSESIGQSSKSFSLSEDAIRIKRTNRTGRVRVQGSGHGISINRGHYSHRPRKIKG